MSGHESAPLGLLPPRQEAVAVDFERSYASELTGSMSNSDAQGGVAG